MPTSPGPAVVATDSRDAAFARYLRSLAASWDGLAAPDPDASVRRAPGFVALRHPHRPVLTNVAVLDAAATGDALAAVAPGPFAAWSHDPAGEAALAAAGLRRDVVTWPMLAALDDPRACDDGDRRADGVREVEPAVVARLNGVDPDLVDGVPGMRAFATAGTEAGLVLQPVEDDVVVSFVVTRPDARRQGWATILLRAALSAVRADGAGTATLQATAEARGLYERCGFRVVGRWQEWVPA
ncbi:GNAT family N-acetyltransferase [Cellulomonas sp. JZ18]|uniref:GNAT family N-acetyltransferase n=1 Tax=Cellulomonas sp. JZ18 TaxID=2654191 RepID=UPI0012D3CC47|nr:GNAT family N-acetyltransferase [Cellulomonas sp. JZ18]QGQ18317.1 GNAT family N-acetyltransferase [Cellulomonas sp. JZ18]